MAVIVSDIIQQSFVDLGVVQPGELISSAMQSAALLIALQMQASWVAEDLMNFNAVELGYTLVANVDSYTLGIGGTFDTFAQNITRVTSWNARSGNFKSSGRILSFDEFAAAAQNSTAKVSVLPEIVAADSRYPLIDIRVHPFPVGVYVGGQMASLNLKGWYQTPAFAALTDSVDSLPPGYQAALHFNLAIALSPQYARVGGVTPELAANAQTSKGIIVAKNASVLGYSQAPQQPAA